MNRFLLIVLTLLSLPALAHRTSDSQINLQIDSGIVTGEAAFALHDLDLLLALDLNADGAITWRELKASDAALQQILTTVIAVRTGTEVCALQWRNLQARQRQQQYYAEYTLTAHCPETNSAMALDYNFLQGIDNEHRALVRLAGELHVLAPGQSLTLAQRGGWQQFSAFVREGSHHIWIGYDHLLFLFCLLLPAALIRRDGRWQAEPEPHRILLEMLKLVTSFTIAHSITLLLASFQILSLPSRLVESIIAGSVLIAALNVLKPVVTRRLWLLTFGFGLIHGFGFAAVLADLALPIEQRASSLLAFNLGIELGQLTVVATLLPLLLWWRHQHWYRRWALPTGAVMAAGVAGIWLLERVGERELLTWF